VLYAALFAGVAGSFFLAWLAPGQRAPPLLPVVLVAGLCAAPFAVALQGADALGAPLSGLTNKAVWRAGLETSFGLTAIATAFALFAALFALQATTRAVARGFSLLGLLTVGLALALSGHASAAAPQWLTRPAVFIHGAAVAFWLGSLIPLTAALRDRITGAAVLARFSRAIPWAIVALVVSGAILAVVQVAQPGLLFSTAYGRLLCAKLLMVALALALAAWNRVRLTPAVAADLDQSRPQLRRSIFAELAIMAIVLALVASWRFTPPPRALALADAKPAHTHIHTAKAMADVTLTPGHSGQVRVEIIIMNGDFGGLDAKEVQLILENREAGIEAIARPATKGTDAVWRIDQFPIPRDGPWDVRIDILVNDFEKIQLDGRIGIGRGFKD
jgi:copper transport protein